MYRLYVTLVLFALLIPVAGYGSAANGAGQQQDKEEAKEEAKDEDKEEDKTEKP